MDNTLDVSFRMFAVTVVFSAVMNTSTQCVTVAKPFAVCSFRGRFSFLFDLNSSGFRSSSQNRCDDAPLSSNISLLCQYNLSPVTGHSSRSSDLG